MELLPALLLGVAGLAMVAVSSFNWLPMALAVCISAMIDVHLRFDVGLKLESGITLQPPDFLSVLAAMAATFRYFSMPKIETLRWHWIIFAAVTGIAFIHGAFSFGAFASAIAFRQFFYIGTIMLYFMSFDYPADDQRKIFSIVLLMSAALALYAVLAWIHPDLLSAEWRRMILVSVFDEYRVLPAVGAMFIGFGFLLSLGAWSNAAAPPITRLLSPFLLLIVVLLYHRSVWVATGLGIAAVLALSRERIRLYLMAMSLGVGLLAVVWTVLAGVQSDVISSSMNAAVQEVAQDDSSLAWRMIGWKALTSRALDQGWLTVLFGAGFGIDFDRRIGWALVTVSPHNAFLEVFLTCGAVGLALYILPLFGTITRLRGLAGHDGSVDAPLLVSIIAALAAYSMAYGLHYDVSMLLGVLAAIAAAEPNSGQRSA